MLAVARFGGQVHFKKGAKGEQNSCKEVHGIGFTPLPGISEHEGTFIDILGYTRVIYHFIWYIIFKEKPRIFLKKQERVFYIDIKYHTLELRGIGDTLVKGVWGMPRLSEAMKDVISCDKLRGLANMN